MGVKRAVSPLNMGPQKNKEWPVKKEERWKKRGEGHGRGNVWIRKKQGKNRITEKTLGT